MEFMDRRRRSLLVQFWLTVESFKNPLESVDTNLSDDEVDAVLDPSRSTTLKEDITMIKELYFSNSHRDPALVSISQRNVDAICSFGLDDETPTLVAERRVRRSVMLAQRQVEQDMEQDFEELQRSELWFRIVADVEASASKLGDSSSQPGYGPSSPIHTRNESSSSSLGVLKRGHVPLAIHIAPIVSRPESLNQHVSPPLQSGSSQTALSKNSASNLELLMSSMHESDGLSSRASSRAPLFDDPDDSSMQDLATQSRTFDAIQ